MNNWMDEEIYKRTRTPPEPEQLGTWIKEARARYVITENHRGQALDYYDGRLQATALGLAIAGMYADAHRALDMYRHKRKQIRKEKECRGDELIIDVCAAMLGVQHKLVHRIASVNQQHTAEEVADMLIRGAIYSRT